MALKPPSTQAQDHIAANESRPTTLPEANRAEGNVGGAARRSAAEPRAPPILSY